MRTRIRTSSYLPAIVAFAASVVTANGSHISDSDVRTILSSNRIENVARVEQQVADTTSVVLLVENNRQETSFGGCQSQRTDLEMLRVQSGWQLVGRNDFSEIALVSCREAAVSGFATLEREISAPVLHRAVASLRTALTIKPDSDLIVTKSGELVAAFKSVQFKDLSSISVIEKDDVEFQFVHDALVPRILGVRLCFALGELTRVVLSDDNSIEVVDGE